MILVQREPPGPGVFRVPGGKPVAIALGVIGFITSTAAIIISVVPAADEANKALAVFKIVGLTVALLAVGALLFAVRKTHVKGSAAQSRD
jgi:hypothetical protein